MHQPTIIETDRQMERLARIEALVSRSEKLQSLGMFDFARLGRRWALELIENLRDETGTLDAWTTVEGEV